MEKFIKKDRKKQEQSSYKNSFKIGDSWKGKNKGKKNAGWKESRNKEVDKSYIRGTRDERDGLKRRDGLIKSGLKKGGHTGSTEHVMNEQR